MEIKNPRSLPTYGDCFVCGQQHPKGLRIRFFTDAGNGVHAWFEPRTDQTGYENVVHGGIISALLDELTGWTISLASNTLAYTAELTLRFLKPVSVGKKYLASARAGEGRGKIWKANGILRDEDGSVYAQCSGTYFLLSAEQTEMMASRMTYRHEDIPVFTHGFKPVSAAGTISARGAQPDVMAEKSALT